MMTQRMEIGEVLRLHTDTRGVVWYGRNNVPAMCSKLSPEDFVHHGMFRDAQLVRVLGAPDNAALIARIHELKLSAGWDGQVFVGSPGTCLSGTYQQPPEYVLGRLWQLCAHAQSCGCWHELSDKEYSSYLMTAAGFTGTSNVEELMLRILPYHPAWPAVSFIPTAHHFGACLLLCEIVDPRWYNHPERPNRISRLWSYLGLTPQNIQALQTETAPQRNIHRAGLVLLAWGAKKPVREPTLPANFLWRIANRYGGPKGVLKASRVFVQFLRLVWLQALAPPGRELFVPSIFFKNEDETVAYNQHVDRLGKRV